jgi:putative salt-induced outer membrane protein YdiY
VDYKCNFTDHFLWYARTNDGFNKITFIDFFAESALGLGFQAIKEDKHKLEFRLGAGYRYESYHTGHWVTIAGEQKTSQSLAGLDIGLNYQYEWGWGRFTDAITYMPAFDDVGNFVLRHEGALEFPVANSENWWIRIGISNDYNSHPASKVRKLETTYFASVVLRWK